MTNNINISKISNILKPKIVKEKEYADKKLLYNITHYRNTISNIIHGKDKRLLVVVGPCSIHNYNEAIDYAKKLVILQNKYKDRLFIVMRVYFEKPRTTIGWKGLIYDPHLDNSYKINDGILLARKLLIAITSLGLPIGCEFLDVFLPQYYADLVSWGAIGARTTESMIHRQLASGLSMPIGFKNGTNGNIDIAKNAIITASNPHTFLGIDNNGVASKIETYGNKNLHIIMRGGKDKPNYYMKDVANTINILREKDVNVRLMIDLSHGNSNKRCKNQLISCNSVCNQLVNNNNIIGIMIESNINEGNQKLINKKDLKYGVSITDECVDINTTIIMLNNVYNSIKHRFYNNSVERFKFICSVKNNI